MPGDGQPHHDRVTYADIFAVPEFRALFTSRALSTIGDYIARAALVIAVFAETGSTALMGITFALTTLPDLIGGPVLAGLADRYPRRIVMVVTDFGRAVLLLVMAIPGMPLPALWALLFLVRLVDAPFNSAYISTMSVVLPGKRLVRGTAVTQLVNHIAYTVGYAAGGVIVGLTGLSVVLVFNAATFALSALAILVGVSARPATAAADSPSSWFGSTRAALRHIAAHPRLWLTMLFTLPIAATLASETLAAPYAAQIGQGPAVAGVLMGSGPAGIVIGLWLLPMLIPDQRVRHVVVLSVLCCAPLVLFFVVPGVFLASLLVVVSGIALYFWIPLAAEFTQAVPDDMRGQAVGLMTTMMRVTQGVAILIFGLVATNALSSTVIAASGLVGTAIVAVLSVAWVRASRPSVPAMGTVPPRGGTVH
ncbi:MFS transporter [Actinophytocola algeriensis]|uniref:Putative MFS family arabinose efflux permease n=1 Tax=Actinophytocola algeriensis TaxID=1768010 RepID=A0A7W7VIW0_9PSEU|nr:MFS transporter [Actinophytocola algeriensis]MBB4911699.1 putative MFS family arabinose efflux permease [Actinophytocola algeriensis]MBE1473313.1 putative MFS family arabinose efflux permease [Actinophytocola algeriensis]